MLFVLEIILNAFCLRIPLQISNLIAMVKRLRLSIGIVSGLLIFASITNTIHAQVVSETFSFSIKKGTDSIGYLKTAQLVNGNKIVRTLSSSYDLSFIFDFILIDFTSDVFVNNWLSTSLMKRNINGTEKVHNITRWTGKGYELHKKDEEVTSLPGAVSHAVTSLYFDEPDNYNTVFSAFYQVILTVKKVDTHRYVLELPKGNKSYYTYKNGLLVNIESHIGIATLYFVMDNPLTLIKK